jgi:hypothetical protein
MSAQVFQHGLFDQPWPEARVWLDSRTPDTQMDMRRNHGRLWGLGRAVWEMALPLACLAHRLHHPKDDLYATLEVYAIKN